MDTLRERKLGWGEEAAGKGEQHPLPASQLPITIKHFNDLLSDEPLDFIIIHHVSLRKQKKPASITLSSLGLISPGNRFHGNKGWEGWRTEVPEASHRY